MKLLCLDPSGIFGWAYGDPFGNGGPPFSGTQKLPDVQPSKKFIALEAWLIDLIKANEITDIVLEQPFLGAKQSFAAVTALAGYVIVSGMAGSKCGCKVTTVDMATWRSELGLPTRGPKNVLSHPDYKHLAKNKTGQKVAQRMWVKDRAMDFAKANGSDPKDDNEGDAVCMFIWKRKRLLSKLQEQGTKRDLFQDLAI